MQYTSWLPSQRTGCYPVFVLWCSRCSICSVLLSVLHNGNNKITEHRAIFQRERQTLYVNKQTKSVNNRKTGKTAFCSISPIVLKWQIIFWNTSLHIQFCNCYWGNKSRLIHVIMEIVSLGRDVSYVGRKVLHESCGRVSDMDSKIDLYWCLRLPFSNFCVTSTSHIKSAVVCKFRNNLHHLRFWNNLHQIRFWNNLHQIRFWNNLHQLRFWNNLHQLRFWNNLHQLHFWNSLHQLRRSKSNDWKTE